MAKKIADFQWETEVGNSLVVREPVGVVGAITPWNYPLYQIALKVAPALAAGCTVVLKPSEVAPLNAFALADVLHDIGLPPGVFNLVTGVGRSSARRSPRTRRSTWCRSPGRTRAGKRVMTLGRRDREEGRPRARRQVGQHHPGGRRPRRRHPGRALRLLHELRPDLLGADADARATLTPGRGRGEGQGGRRGLHSRQLVRAGRPDSARSSRRSSATGCGATSKRASTRGPSS